MVDNFAIIKSLLEFNSKDDFYHLQLIKRKKDNPGLPGKNNNSRCIKTYYVTSPEYLEDRKAEIIGICTATNSRACINLNRRSFEKLAYQTLKKISDQILNKDFEHVRKAYESVCGAYSNESDKKWIIDIDDVNFNAGHFLDHIYNLAPYGEKGIAKIGTKNGYHLIVKPFNVAQLRSDNEIDGLNYNFDIHKDNPTILYIP